MEDLVATSTTPAGNRPRSKADRAYEYIKEQIDAAKFQPHERVLAGPLTVTLGMSSVSIREAIQRLSDEGILSIEHNVGARVAVFYGQAYHDGLESLAVMDGVATALADQQISTADLERAEAYSDQIIVVREDFDPVLIVDAERARATVVEHQKILELIRTKVSRPEIEQTARHHVLASPQARTEVQSELLKTENV